MKKWGFSLGSSKLNVDENLPYFLTGLKISDADWLYKENENLVKNYGVSIINEEVADVVRRPKLPKKPIQDIPYYIILANPKY